MDGRTDKLLRQAAIKLGENRGRPRIYLSGRWLLKAGFKAGAALAVTFGNGQVVLALDAAGDRTVSVKRDLPCIDVNCAALAEALQGAKELVVRAHAGTLVIRPARTAAKAATRCRNGKEGSLFSGAGFLSEAARQAGYEPAWAVEWDERYAEIYEANHPGAVVHNMSVAEVEPADLEPVELLTIGIPCEPYSTVRRNGHAKGAVPEQHELGDMVYWALKFVDALNPATVVVEEVPGFLDAGAGWVLRHALTRMGYQVRAEVVDSAEHGQLAGRRRAVVIAATGAAPALPAPAPCTTTLASTLEPQADGWFDAGSKRWLFQHWQNLEAKGSNFANQAVLTGDTTRVPAITKRYFNGQGGGPVVAHPTKPGTFRWLTLGEVRRLHGVPEHYQLPAAKTVAGEVIGQAVVVPLWKALIEAQGRGA